MWFTPILQSAAQGGITGAAAVVLALNVAAGAGGVQVTGSGAVVQAVTVAAGAGNTATSESDGSGAVTLSPVVVAGVGAVQVSGAGATVQQATSDAGAGAVAISGAGAATTAPVVSSSGGTVWAPTTMPSGAILFFDPSTIAAADGASVGSFTDSIGGYVATQATGTKQPKFKANAKAGRPGLVFDGTQFLTFDGTGPLKTAIDSGDFTVMMLVSDVGATSVGSVFGASAGSTAFNLIANGTYIGRYDGNVTGHTVPWNKSDFVTLTVTSENAVAGNYGGMGIAFERDYVNGATCYRSTNTAVPGTTAQFALGAQGSSGTSLGKFTLLGAVAYPRHLTPVEVLQLEVAMRQRLNQPLPWGGLARFDIGDGDSISDQVGIDPQYGFHYLMQQQRGHKYGQWSNFSIGAIRAQQSTAKFQEIADFLTYLGIPGNLTFFEYINGKNAGRTSAQLIQDLKDYVTTARVKAPSARLNMADSTGYGDDVSVHPYATNRGVFNASFADASTGLGPVSDAITRISLDPLIGDGGAFSNYGATYIQSDTVHPNVAGHAQLATDVLPGLTALDTASTSFGSGSPTLTPATAAGAGGPVVSGTGAATTAPQAASGSGAVADPGVVVGTGAASTTPVAAASAGQVEVDGAGALGQAPATAAGAGGPVASGSGSATLAPQSAAATGTVADPGADTGVGSVVLVPVTSAGAGAVAVDGQAAIALALVIASGSGRVVYPGQALQLTSGFVTLRRKRTWSTSK